MISFSDIDCKNRETLVALERKYYKQSVKANKLKNNKLSKKKYVAAFNKAADTKQQINKILLPLFMVHNQEFKDIADKNYKIVDNKNLKLKTRKTGRPLIGYRADVLSGSINKNGLIYCNIKEVATGLREPYSNYIFPSHFTGYINCLGYVYFQVSRTDYSMFKTLPKTFSCKVYDNGKADMHTEDRDYEFLSEEVVTEIIGTIFSSISEKDSFFENKAKLIEIINDYRELYLKEIKI
ncbi:MAG: hypothetical protein N4A72_08715 [Bacteroidales bacterium]|jgi:hypothetical protein|nr:hypothetical protein [Bacteroidales bacterium]